MSIKKQKEHAKPTKSLWQESWTQCNNLATLECGFLAKVISIWNSWREKLMKEFSATACKCVGMEVIGNQQLIQSKSHPS